MAAWVGEGRGLFDSKRTYYLRGGALVVVLPPNLSNVESKFIAWSSAYSR